MADRLAILVWAADPAVPELCATPFYFAAAAAAMDAEVEMYFTARSVRLLARGVAETLYADGTRDEVAPGGRRAVADFLQEAHRYGVRFYACPSAMQAHGVAADALRAEVAGQAGAAAFLGRALDDGWRTLTF
ncbi:DsrE family protein [Pseudothauera rhizosphaerae]|uniref:Peroxiredoxin n=1 Tax=Pseudothauera rhizosphaerae TaxID=2565932 RepID=A0A4S4AQX1_9RHOO|nr:DsrE family protein [Pseudothauera rhizosphaerae]THF62097.1 peroxiredoxin [Pseudothauera rhizosphaerae]